ncbi:hypothetical protein [Nocardia sp. NPDC058705]|uniref:hypothetical protein n=1 Tax=Nocardia sp. NPDC058705 TaxID=3346609 RepID=UPI00368D07D5
MIRSAAELASPTRNSLVDKECEDLASSHPQGAVEGLRVAVAALGAVDDVDRT